MFLFRTIWCFQRSVQGSEIIGTLSLSRSNFGGRHASRHRIHGRKLGKVTGRGHTGEVSLDMFKEAWFADDEWVAETGFNSSPGTKGVLFRPRYREG